MGPLGFYSLCLKTSDLDATVAYCRRLGFVPTVSDAGAWRSRDLGADGTGWVGIDPDRRRLGLLPHSMLPRLKDR